MSPRPSGGLITRPPFRSPHHGVSAVALIGGGRRGHAARRDRRSPMAASCSSTSSASSRPPCSMPCASRLEEGVVRVSRARGSISYPARFLLVGAMNPCPCGEGGVPGACRCSAAGPRPVRPTAVRPAARPLRHRRPGRATRRRGPAGPAPPGEWLGGGGRRVRAARRRARRTGGACQRRAPGRRARRGGPPRRRRPRRSSSAACGPGRLSARGLHRVRRLARTLADLDGAGPTRRVPARGRGPLPAG